MKSLSRILVGASGVLAVMPGLAAILRALGTPPGRTELYGGLLVAAGTLTLLSVAYSKGRIQRLRARVVAAAAFALFFASVSLACVYGGLYRSVVVKHVEQFHADAAPRKVDLFFPLSPGGELAEMIEFAGGRDEAIAYYDVTRIQVELSRQGLPLAMTELVLVLVLTLCEVSLVGSLALGGFRSMRERRGRQPQARRHPAKA